jgi:hypothetical protein
VTALLLLALTASAQSTSEPWRTVQTEHYRLHYPADSAEWALYTAARLEAIRALVAEEVGFEPTQRVDIVVMDPFAQANGFAIPFLRGPRMGVFPTAPDPASGIGHYRSWPEDLIVHEDAHLVHLLRPSRSPALRALLSLFVGVGPVSLTSPAWVVEGYATVVEGRLTGLGRPNSDGRAAFLRTLSAQGQLPPYSQLDAPDRWSGGSYRYLVGSAFLEWLVDRSHPDALRDLFARQTAREVRSFEEAFEGVFGDDPATLYARFCAELTHEAIQIEAHRPVDEGTLWQDLSRSTDAPAVSPSGDRIATILRPKDAPAELVVYGTGADEEAGEAWRESLPDRERDPEDVDPVPPAVLAREPLFSHTAGGRAPWRLRWIDEDTLLFTDFVIDAAGDRCPELFTWSLTDGRIRRVTHGGHVRDADPHGDRAVALRTRHGLSELVSVDLTSGEITALIGGGPDEVYASPRLSPDGAQVSWLSNRDGWRILVANIDGSALSGEPVAVDLPPGRSILSYAWHPDGTALIASLGHAGFIELYRVPLTGGGEQLTISRSSALDPAPTPDGQAIFFLSPDVEGMNLHRFEVSQARAADWDDEQLRLALGLTSSATPPPPPDTRPPLAVAEVIPRRYGTGRPEVRLAVGSVTGPDQGTGEIGLWMGDVVGRHEVLAFYSSRIEAPGVRGAVTWRGLPVRLKLDASLLDMSQPIAELSAARLQHWRDGGLDAAMGVWLRDGGISGGGSAALEQRVWTGPLWWGGSLGGQLAAGDLGAITTADASLSGGYSMMSLDLSGGLGWAERTPFLLGGLPDPLLPELSDLSYVWAAGLSPGTDAGTQLSHLRAQVGLWEAIYLFGERYDLTTSSSQLGLMARLSLAPQPLVRVTGLELTAGVACRLSTAGVADPTPCVEAEDLSGWLGVLMRPGRTTYLPDR